MNITDVLVGKVGVILIAQWTVSETACLRGHACDAVSPRTKVAFTEHIGRFGPDLPVLVYLSTLYTRAA